MNLYKSYGIYGIQNEVDGHIYVGKTEMNFGDRRDCHYAMLRSGHHSNPNLQDAWEAYGEKSFKFVVLHECVNHEDSDVVNGLEKKYIKKYKDAGLAYNIGEGGDSSHLKGKHMPEETKRKIGEKNKINMTGRGISEGTRRAMSESQKKRYESWTDEDRENYGRIMSERARGYRWSEESKKRFSEKQKTAPNGAKYSIEQVIEARDLFENKGLSCGEIAERLNMTRQAVYLIVTYRRWKNV